jgi:hypothetical protein
MNKVRLLHMVMYNSVQDQNKLGEFNAQVWHVGKVGMACTHVALLQVY